MSQLVEVLAYLHDDRFRIAQLVTGNELGKKMFSPALLPATDRDGIAFALPIPAGIENAATLPEPNSAFGFGSGPSMNGMLHAEQYFSFTFCGQNNLHGHLMCQGVPFLLTRYIAGSSSKSVARRLRRSRRPTVSKELTCPVVFPCSWDRSETKPYKGEYSFRRVARGACRCSWWGNQVQ